MIPSSVAARGYLSLHCRAERHVFSQHPPLSKKKKKKLFYFARPLPCVADHVAASCTFISVHSIFGVSVVTQVQYCKKMEGFSVPHPIISFICGCETGKGSRLMLRLAAAVEALSSFHVLSEISKTLELLLGFFDPPGLMATREEAYFVMVALNM